MIYEIWIDQMKLTPKTYAKTLIESLSESNVSFVAANFIDILYKNKQQKDLRKILNLLDEEYATKNKLVLAKIYSVELLSAEKQEEIKAKFEKKFNTKILAKNILRQDKIAGITVEIDGMIYDYSISGKLENFKKALNS